MIGFNDKSSRWGPLETPLTGHMYGGAATKLMLSDAASDMVETIS